MSHLKASYKFVCVSEEKGEGFVIDEFILKRVIFLQLVRNVCVSCYLRVCLSVLSFFFFLLFHICTVFLHLSLLSIPLSSFFSFRPLSSPCFTLSLSLFLLPLPTFPYSLIYSLTFLSVPRYFPLYVTLFSLSLLFPSLTSSSTS